MILLRSSPSTLHSNTHWITRFGPCWINAYRSESAIMDISPLEPAGTTANDDKGRVRLLNIDKIWDAVRSGGWYSKEETIPESESGLDGNTIQDTTALITERLSELQGTDVASPTASVELADIVTNAQKDIQDYSTPELKCILAALQSLSSPWRKLPAELIVEIFSWCISPYAVLGTSHAPLLLTQICLRWYNLSVNTPSLWTSLILIENFLIHPGHLRGAADFEDKWQSKYALDLGIKGGEFISTILRRSRTLPLSLSTHSGILFQPDTSSLFYENVSRSKHLALLFPKPKHRHPPIPPAPAPLVAPLLETLDLYAMRTRGPPPGSRTPNWASPFMNLIQSSTPTLRQLNVIMRGTGVPSWPVTDSSQSWDQLTHITWVPAISVSDVIRLFASAPNLVYASFPGISRPRDSAIEALQPEPVVSKSLKTLIFWSEDSRAVFDAMTLPNLRHLVHLAPSDRDRKALIAFLRRSACSLETLYLYHALYSTTSALLEILGNVEAGNNISPSDERDLRGRGHLKSLLIADGHPENTLLSDEFMERLKWTSRRHRENDDMADVATDMRDRSVTGVEDDDRDVDLFPELKHLSLYNIGPLAAEKLPAMLRSRTADLRPLTEDSGVHHVSTSPAKLRVFETWDPLTRLNSFSPEDWKVMETLRDVGLVLRTFNNSNDLESCMTDAENLLLKRYVEEEGLVVRDYSHDTGQFVPVPLYEEIGTCKVVSQSVN